MEDIIRPLPLPELHLPQSTSLVTVYAVDTTLLLSLNSVNFVEPSLPGHKIYDRQAMAFLIVNENTGRKIQFDLGARKDFWDLAPSIADGLKTSSNIKGIQCRKGVDEVLVEAGENLKALEAVVWSHYHFDHTGDMSRFPSSVKLIVGPGFKSKCLPGYPTNPESPILETDYFGRELEEIHFRKDLQIGKFKAHDYFGDGSFYLLDVPGHAVGHMCGLARTTSDTFALLGGDTCHFMGALRPTPYMPLPSSLDVKTHGLDTHLPDPCPCSVLTSLHPSPTPYGKRTTPFYKASSTKATVYSFPEVANQSIDALKEFDANEQVLVCLAHDPSLFDVFPILKAGKRQSINGWKAKRWKDRLKWRFLSELPRDGDLGSNPSVYGYWRDGKMVDADDAMRRDD